MVLYWQGTLWKLDYTIELVLGNLSHTQVGVSHLYFIIFAPIELLDLLSYVLSISMENQQVEKRKEMNGKTWLASPDMEANYVK